MLFLLGPGCVEKVWLRSIIFVGASWDRAEGKKGKRTYCGPWEKILSRQKLLVNKGSGGGIVREIEKIIEIR